MVKRSLLFVALLIGCRPELAERVSLVESQRLLAVRATPAEARPGESIALEALFVDTNGTIASAPVDWSFCVERRALAESTPIASACLSGASGLVPLGVGAAAQGTLPADGCRLFGPDRPEPKPGEPSGRATDPDASGGYYQPLRLGWPGAVSVSEVRIRCGLAGATQEQVAQFGGTKMNENPSILAVERAGVALPRESEPAAPVVRGERLALRVNHSEPETYLWLDPVSRTLIERRETVRVSWYATAGSFDSERTADGNNTWTAPDVARDVVLWAVVRDDRGGVAFSGHRVRVQ